MSCLGRTALLVLLLATPAAALGVAQSGGVWAQKPQPTSRPTTKRVTDFDTPRQQDPTAKKPSQQPPQQAPQQPAPKIRTDANGWPVLTPATPRQPVSKQPVPKSPQQHQPSPSQVPAKPGGPGSADKSTLVRGPLERPLADQSLLQDVFQQVGRPEEVAELKCVVAWMSVKLFGYGGTELGELQLHHEADFRHTRDRLLFSRPSRGPDKIYGRDGRSVFAERHGMAWPSLVPKAREELEIFGLLLRMPWAFGDSDRFVVTGRDEDYTVNGRAMVRLRIERRPQADGTQGADTGKKRDRFDLICPKHRMEPSELHMRLGGSGVTTVVRLSRYKSFRGIRIPTQRDFMSESGYRLMEVRITRMDVGQDLPQSQFRPHQR